MEDQKKIGNLVAIKKFMERQDKLGGTACKMAELQEFKAACSSEELEEFGEQCRQELDNRTL